MATISQLRDGLVTRLETISGLRATAFHRGSVNPPEAVIYPPEIDYDATFGGTADVLRFPIYIFVAYVSPEAAEKTMNAYLSRSAARSIKKAIEADATLGGIAADATVRTARETQPYNIGSVDLLGARLDVEVSTELT